MLTLPASLGLSLSLRLSLLYLILSFLLARHGHLYAQPLLLLLGLGLDLLGRWLFANLQLLTLLGFRNLNGVLLGLRDGIWLGLVWVYLRLHMVATA